MAESLKIVSGRCSYDLARKIARRCGTELGRVSFNQFLDGEIQPVYEENIGSSDVYIIQSTPPPSENFQELLMMIDAARSASARSIVAIIPYFGYSRQDRQDRPGVSITASLHARLLSAAGVSRIITLDLHSDQMEGFFDAPFVHLRPTKLFCSYIQSLKLDPLTFGAKEISGAVRAEHYASLFEADFIIFHKSKPRFNRLQKLIVGDVKGRNVILVDDIVDTAHSICQAAQYMMYDGAASVRAIVTHPLLSGDAYKIIEDSVLEELVVTDSVQLRRDCPKIKVLSIAEMIAEVIEA
jgi:ribose-phosphate pyrophosphokinase